MGGFSTPTAVVSTFIGLSDTPASYVGETGKVPFVNPGESALEFGDVAPAQQYPVFVSTVLYNNTKDQTYETLDCGVGKAMVYLKVTTDAAIGAQFNFLPNDYADETNMGYSIGKAVFAGAGRVAYVLVTTDSAGLVKWAQTTAFLANVITVTLLAYWLNPATPGALVFDGVTVAAYTDLDLGVPNALAIIRVTRTDPTNAIQLTSRMRGDPKSPTVGFCGCTCCVCGAGTIGIGMWLLVATDGEGKIEWKDVNAGRSFTIHLMSYIVGPSFRRIDAFSGNAPLAFADLVTPGGKCVGYIRTWHSADAGAINYNTKQKGEAFDPWAGSNLMLTNCAPVLDDIGYNFVLIDEAGVYEWMADAAFGTDVRLEVSS